MLSNKAMFIASLMLFPACVTKENNRTHQEEKTVNAPKKLKSEINYPALNLTNQPSASLYIVFADPFSESEIESGLQLTGRSIDILPANVRKVDLDQLAFQRHRNVLIPQSWSSRYDFEADPLIKKNPTTGKLGQGVGFDFKRQIRYDIKGNVPKQSAQLEGYGQKYLMLRTAHLYDAKGGFQGSIYKNYFTWFSGRAVYTIYNKAGEAVGEVTEIPKTLSKNGGLRIDEFVEGGKRNIAKIEFEQGADATQNTKIIVSKDGRELMESGKSQINGHHIMGVAGYGPHWEPQLYRSRIQEMMDQQATEAAIRANVIKSSTDSLFEAVAEMNK